MKFQTNLFLRQVLTPLACILSSALTVSTALAGVAADIISINDISVTEGDTGTTAVSFTVTRSTNTAEFSLNWASANGTAIEPGDYTKVLGTLSFAVGGNLTETVTVTVNGDILSEANETVFVRLSALAVTSGKASIISALGVGTITNDDAVAPLITKQPADTSVVAGSAATLTVVATGNPSPTYQWYRGAVGVNTAPVGTNSASFTTPGLGATTSYWVRVSTLAGTVDSRVATVTVPDATNALLGGLALSQGTLSPVLSGASLSYSASLGNSVTSVDVTPTVAIAGATLDVNVAGAGFVPTTSGNPFTVSLNPGANTVAFRLTARDGTTISTTNLNLFRVPAVYTSAIRDVVEPNQGAGPAAGVTIGGSTFINLGLQGVGRVPAAMKDPVTGESVGSVSDMQITRFVRNTNGSYTGTMEMLPDRGYNAGTIYSNYAARINTFTFSFTPYTAAAPTTAQNQITLTFAGSTRFTYDHDANALTAPVFTTGLLADGPATMLFGTQVPVVLANTTQSDGTVANRLTLDTEGLAFDKRPGKAGSGWVSDEYGAYIYHFNAARQIDGQLQLPAALVPHNPVGTNNFLLEGVNGRRINQGMEGLAVSPDGTRLFALLQSATIQDSGTGNYGRSNARLLVYDISTSYTPSDPIAQYVVQLPRADDTGSLTNGVTVNRNCAQSAIVALNGHQILILAREGNGRGVPGSPPPAFKSVLLAELNGATNIDGTYDAEGAQVAPAGTLAAGITPVSWTEALNMLGKLDPARADVEKFGLNLLGGHGDINTLSEKWEGLSVVSANDPANRNDYFLFLGNDNDFLSTTGAYMDASGALQTYDGGVENDTVILAYRVRLTGPDNQAPFLETAIPAQNAGVGMAFSFAFAATSFADPENQTLTYSATKGDDSALPAWLTFNPATRQFSGTPALADSGTHTIKVTATDSGTPALSATTTFTITVGQPVTIAATSVAEGNSGTATITFTITRTVADTEFTVNYAVSGTASSGSDYVAIPSGTLTFTAGGPLAQTVIATVNGDTTIEANETIVLTLSGLANITGLSVLPGTGAATGTITNDDFVPSRFPATGVVTSTVKGFIDLDVPPLTGGAEIPAFDPASKRAFTSSGSGVQVIDLTNPAAPAFISTITPATLAVAGLTSNDVSSVTVRKASGANPAVLAASVIASPKTDPGHVVFLNAADGTLLGSVQVGANPDHIAFTPDGTKLLVAIEAETAGNVDLDTTPGGVTILDLSGGLAAPAVTTADFTAWDAQAAALSAAGVRLFQGGMPSTDLEPEYFAVSADGTKAMVTLQEANAVAVLDIPTATFTDIKPLGKKDFALGAHDFSDRDGAGAVNLANPISGQPVFGLYMPDAIASYTAGGQTYYVTANEGDDRDDFITPVETTTVGATNYDLDDTVFPNEAALKNQASLGRLTVSNVPGIRGDTDGDGDIDEILSYGGRSFSILDAAGNMVFDSGDMLENIMASQFLSNFDDGRSDNKGPEPEGVTIATIGARTFAFLSLERSHMVAVFDVTNPNAVKFVSGLRRTGDTNPEGSVIVSPVDSPTGKALLLVANEKSQTLTIHELDGLVDRTVASGDVTRNAATLWAHGFGPGTVTFEYSTDATFATGVTSVMASVPEALKPASVNITGLTAGTVYHYRASNTANSTAVVTGMFRTSAAPMTIAGLKFGVSGDQRGELAPFPSIKNAAGKSLEFFMQLGDNVYGDVASPALPTAQARSLTDYRARHDEIYSTRYGMNTFADLRATTPILATIDDHEVTNDFSGAEPRTSDPRFAADTGTLVSDTQTFLNGIQAFREYMPMQMQQYGATGDPIIANRAKLYRYNTYGKDAATFMVDTRSFRSAPIPAITNPSDNAQVFGFLVNAFAPGRTMLGTVQKADFKSDLLAAQASGIVWKFVFCPEPVQNFGPLAGEDRYEGYAAERTELLKFIDDNNISNVVFVAADFHGTAINRLSYQMGPGQPQIQTDSIEVITGSVAYDRPFGPTIVDLATGFGLITAPQRAFYDSLTPAQAPQREGFIQGIINPTLATIGYNQLSLTTNPLPNVTLLGGLYTATHTYGWTEFTIDQATQKLNVRTWGIEPYSKAQLDADPAAVTARMPAVVSEFEMTPEVPMVNAAAQAGLTIDGNCSPLNLLAASGAMPPGGTFSGTGVEGGTFDPATAALGVNVISYTVGTQSVNFNITVTAAPSLPVTQTNALALTMKSTLVLTDTGTTSGVGGSEIPAFDAVSKRAFSASNVGVQVVDLTNPSAPVKLAPIDPTTLGLTSKDVSHVAVKNGVLAVSLIAIPDKTMPGTVAFFNAGTGALLGSVAVGAVPDQLAWTPDGMKVLVANEGEIPAPLVIPPPPALPPAPPFDSDPEGSVSVIDVSAGFGALTVQTATFHAWNGQEAMMRASGIRVFPGNAASDDLEPEYVAISPDGTKAMVTLQEANAIATLDIASATITAVTPMGLKNYARVTGDFSDRDGAANANAIELKPNLPAFGMFMPDGIASYSTGGQTYYITANEGDDRNDFITPVETTTLNATVSTTVGMVTTVTPVIDLDDTIFPTEGTPGGSGAAGASGTDLKGNDQLGRLTVSNVPGLRGDLDGDGDVDRILSYGGRSFSILDASGKRVFDSGDLIDRIFAANYPAFWDDSRSDNKSAEPEGVTVSVIGGRAYAFVGLERFHSVLVFDVTDPANVTFVTVASRRGDLNPEGMLVVPAADSPTGYPLLIVANENSFTLTTYEITPATPPMQLQVLHYYGESGLLGIQTAPTMGAMIDKFDNEYPTMVLAEGDTFIPGPWLIAGADPSLNAVLGIGVTALGRPDIAIMNAFGTTASALGNHEFDLGSPVFQAAITTQTSGASTFPGAQFPFITANLDFASDSSLRGQADSTVGGTSAVAFRGDEVTNIRARLAPYAVKTVAGQRIGIVGSTTWELLTKSSPNGTRPKDDANDATSDIQEVAAYVQRAVDALRATGVNKIIMVDQLDTLQRNKDFAGLVSGIDIMVAGGGHERMGDSTDTAVGFNGHDADFIGDAYPIVTVGADGKPVLIVTTDTEYSYLGRLVVDFDANGELITSALNPVVNGAYASSPALLESIYNNGQTAAQIVAASAIGTKVKAIVDALNAVVVAKDGNIYGFTKVYLEGDRVFGRAQEVNLGNLTADANAFKARDALGLPTAAAVVSLKNGGGLRSSIGSVAADGSKVSPLANPLTGKPQGGISQLDTENALRFDNKLIVFDTNPAGLMAILEYAAGLAAGNGGYPQVGNIRFSYDKTLTPKVRSVSLINDAGGIVAKVAENGVILPSAPVLIQAVSLNFIANGGDAYPIKYLDPGAVPRNQVPNPDTDNFRFILNNGTLSAPIARNLDFTAAANVPINALGEQRAFADYVGALHPTLATGYVFADTPIQLDTRIQQFSDRAADTVLMNSIEEWRQFYFNSPDGIGPAASSSDWDFDGVDNLMEFALGTNPSSASTGVPELIFSGTFAAGTVTLRGQPIQRIEQIPNSVDFRYVFIRRKDHAVAGITYRPEFSTDLTNWVPSTAVPQVLTDDGTWQTVSVPYTRFITGRKARFARLTVTMP